MNNEMSNMMNDLGEPYPTCGNPDCKLCESKDNKIHYPRETFTTDQLPSLDGAQVGDKVVITMVAEVCGVRSGSEYDMPMGGEEDNKTRVTLKMMKGKASVQSMKENKDIKAMKDTKQKNAYDFGEAQAPQDNQSEE